ncbi:helix-turn-helix domain-containing protein [Vagococcus acidifermentans]|nr:helix-turn-helix domain-containing protein [Vagococcus acidifermentans]
MNLFLSAKEEAKLKMLKELIFNDKIVLASALKENLEISERTIERYIAEINEDIAAHLENDDIYIEKTSGRVIFHLPKSSSPQYVIDYLKMIYMENSLEYNILECLFKEKYASVSVLAEKLYITPSSLYKKIYQIEETFNSFGLKFIWGENVRSNLAIQEKKLRYLYYYLYWNIFKGFRKFPGIPTKEIMTIQQAVALNPVKLKQLEYILYIIKQRLVSGHRVELPNEIKEVIRIFSQKKDLSVHFISVFNNYPEQSDERLYFNHFARIVISELDTESERIEIGKSLAACANRLTDTANKFLIELGERFNGEFLSDDYYEKLYYVTLFLVFDVSIDIEVPDDLVMKPDSSFFEKMSPENYKTLAKLKNFYLQFVSLENLPTKNIDVSMLIVSNLINSEHSRKPFLIYVEFTASITGGNMIKRKISHVFNEANVQFTNDIRRADLIISDTVVEHFVEKEYYYMDVLTDKNRWEKLFELIQNKLMSITFHL